MRTGVAKPFSLATGPNFFGALALMTGGCACKKRRALYKQHLAHSKTGTVVALVKDSFDFHQDFLFGIRSAIDKNVTNHGLAALLKGTPQCLSPL
jgi:hypothetical protein